MRYLKIALAVSALLLAGAAVSRLSVQPIDGWPSEQPQAVEWPPCPAPWNCLERSYGRARRA